MAVSYKSPGSLYTYLPKCVAWNERDLLLFANSIGCEHTELHYLYELHPEFTAFPTYSITLTFKHDYASTASFQDHFTRHLMPPKASLSPSFPGLDVRKVVDGERTLEVLRQVPTTSERRPFVIKSSVIGVWDKGAGRSTILQTEHLLVERVAQGKDCVYTRMTETAVFMHQGGWGGPNPPSPSAPPAMPKTSPTARFTYHIPRHAHLLYRLNGDYNPLHATSIPAAVVQPTPIMHGLYSWNVVARGLLATFTSDTNARALKSFRARFVSPVRPGDVLETAMWLCKDCDIGQTVVRFETSVAGNVVLAAGQAVLRSDMVLGQERSRL